MTSFKLLAAIAACTLALLSTPLRAADAPIKIEKMFVFGDSYSDQGEGQLVSDGPTAVVFMAQRLGFRLAPSNTEDPKYRSLNYSISGAQTGSGAGKKTQDKLSGYGMKNQVDDFVEQVRSSYVDFDPKTTLFFLAGGLNDSKLADGVSVANEEDEIRTLYKAGARHFAVALLTEAIPFFGKQGQRLNPALSKVPDDLKAELKDADIYVSHWGLFFDEVLLHPEKYGLTNTTDPCLKREPATTCTTPEKYFYYFILHPSTAAHKPVGDMLYDELMSRTGLSRTGPAVK